MRLFHADRDYLVRDREGVVREWRCVHANDCFAWLVQHYDEGHAAYCWMQDGKPVNLPGYVAIDAVSAIEKLANAIGYTLVKFGVAA